MKRTFNLKDKISELAIHSIYFGTSTIDSDEADYVEWDYDTAKLFGFKDEKIVITVPGVDEICVERTC